ncbi:MAG: hypothetical protein DME26_06135 [Verrucomicrobia bacterium]|nr:MAG: hypothetical protein DME26_06135 [Verrucomicrobiota bacterium]
MSPPPWALLQRELLRANTSACQEFFAKYFDERGYLRCVERWGGDDGPDDAIENVADWPVLHALGAPDVILRLYKKAWEGHLQQFTEAKTVEVPLARDGMYYKEFPVMFDWQHNGEGLRVFNLQGLSDPNDASFARRVRRYAGFYMNEDPGAPNYDPQHRIIRSLFNGSRGPLLRKATALDWAGDPIEVENRFHLGHGERSYKEMLAHFNDYTNIVGDHPLNLLSTTLALNAYMLTRDVKYRQWLIEYVDAWRERMMANGGIIPSNVGLDGKIGGETDGKWYGGTYGWGFTVAVPQTGKLDHRNRTHWSFVAFMNAFLLTGDDRYLEAWRRQTDAINAQSKVINGRRMYPRMHGDQGWYGWESQPYNYNALEIYYLSMKASDRARVPASEWLEFLDGKNPGYPEAALRRDLERVRQRVQGMRADTTTPDTRLADDPMKYNPASASSLVELMLGGWPPDRRAPPLFCRVRYFDPIERRAGIPRDIAALVESLTTEGMKLTLVNTNQVEERTVVLQGGAYGEHLFKTATVAGTSHRIEAPAFSVRLAAGTGAQLDVKMARYALHPTLAFPWDRLWLTR